jgi:uncharacterized protein YdeI (YjbR/CyaY-like superfamily)
MTMNESIPGGTVHELPTDLATALRANAPALTKWASLTPLARNEWICWIETAKKSETRVKRINWGCENLRDGKSRPCCWPGCPHRERTAAKARQSQQAKIP